MPIQIKELHIKATISDTRSKNNFDKSELRKEKEILKKEIIQESVNEILEILKEKTER